MGGEHESAMPSEGAGSSDVEARRALAAVRQRLFGGTAAPTRVGHYEVIERLGEGGMGVVYLCRDPRLHRRVAVKVVQTRGSVAGARQRARLVREAQALAQVNDPHVIEVYDVGTVGAQVYIAMELVDGVSLSQWCERHSRTSDEIVAMFVQVGQGLSAAHRAGLVHRDFKPDNVVIGAEGRARVLDFGVARALTELAPTEDLPLVGELSTASRVTAPGVVLGTPAYMAPEQARDRSVDARADQFSFCVALYEALHGVRPFGGRDLATVLRAIEQGQTRRGPRSSRVPRWLDTVMRRGLRPHPGQRFASMRALLDALAQPRRRRVSRGLLALAGAGVMLTSLGVVWGGGGPEPATTASIECTDVDDAMDSVWNGGRASAIREAFAAVEPVKGDAIWERVRGVLDTRAQAWRQVAREVCVSRAAHAHGETYDDRRPPLDAQQRCLDEQHRDLAALVTLLIDADDIVMLEAAKAVATLESPARCRAPGAVASRLGVQFDAEVDAVRDEMARARGQLALGQRQAATTSAQAAVQRARKTGDEVVIAEAQLVAGTVAARNSRIGSAREHLEAAVNRAEARGYDFVVARAATQLAFVEAYLASRADAGRRWIQVAASAIDRLGGDPLLEAARLNALGAVLVAEGRYEDAIDAYTRCLDVARERLGALHPKTLQTAMNLGVLLRMSGRIDEAIVLTGDTLTAAEQTLGALHPQVAALWVNLGSAFAAARRPAEAIPAFERAVTIYEHGNAEPSAALAMSWSNLSVAQALQGQLDDALDAARKARRLGEQIFGPDDPKVAQMLSQEGNALRRLGRLDEALTVTRESLRRKRAAMGDAHPGVAASLLGLAGVLSQMDRPHDAKRAIEEGLAISLATLPAEHPKTALARLELGIVELRLDRPQVALPLVEAALAILDNHEGFASERALAQFTLARVLTELGREPSRARAHYLGARPVLLEHRPGLRDELDGLAFRLGGLDGPGDAAR